MKCDGNRNQICGGSWVNSVYSGIYLTRLLPQLNVNLQSNGKGTALPLIVVQTELL